MADFEENIRKLRAVAQASADKLRMREAGTSGFEGAPPPPQAKRPRFDGLEGEQSVPAPPMEPPPFSVIKVPDQLVGLLIGKGGAGLKHLEAENFVRITVGKLVEGGHRRVCIEGDPGCQAKAASMIEHFVTMKEAQDAAKTVLTKQVTSSEIIQIPEQFAGLLIGRGGENIRRIREHFGVNTHLDKETAPGGVRVLTLRGTAQAVAAAREQVEIQLLSFHRKDGVFNRALEEKYGQMAGNDRLPPPPMQPAPGGDGNGSVDAMRPQVPAQLSTAFPRQPDVAMAEGGAPAGMAPHGAGMADSTMPPPPPAMPQWTLQLQGPPLQPSLDDPLAAASWAARYEEVLPWAAHYAKDRECVDYYLQLREAAAEAASCMLQQCSLMGMA